jgi:hypothetical protein
VVRKSLILALVMAFAGAAYAANKGKDVTLTGYVIDAACAAKHANDANVADEIKGHSKGCALSAGCVAASSTRWTRLGAARLRLFSRAQVRKRVFR